MSTRAELRSEISGWMEAARLRYLDVATSKGISPYCEVNQTVAENVTEEGAQFSVRRRRVSPLSSASPSAWLLEARAEEGPGLPAPPLALYEAFGEGCNVWSLSGPAVEGVEGASSVAPGKACADRLLMQSLRYYLRSLESLDEPNRPLRESVIAGLIELVEAENLYYVTQLPIAGLRIGEQPVEHKGVAVRRLTNAELGNLFGWHEPSPTHPEIQVVPVFPTRSVERCVLSVRSPSSKLIQPHSLRPRCVVSAFQILGFDLRGKGHATNFTEPGPSAWQGGSQFRLAERGGIRDFSMADLAAVVRLADMIPEQVFSSPSTKQHMAIHRFGVAAVERDPADAIVDFVTALEATLLDGGSELTFRCALFGAKYLEPTPELRRPTFDKLRRLYALRSKLVHGAGAIPRMELEEHRGIARELTGRVLAKAIECGWPTKSQLEALALA